MMNSTNRELLSILLGEEGESYSKRTLAELFGLRAVRQPENLGVAEEIVSYVAPGKLLAARELLRRALAEAHFWEGRSLRALWLYGLTLRTG
jgi:hypothetical protein